MTKNDFLAHVAGKSGLNIKVVEQALAGFIDTAKDALSKGERITFVGFGTFCVVERSAREYRVPGSDKKVLKPHSKVVKFNVGQQLKTRLKG